VVHSNRIRLPGANRFLVTLLSIIAFLAGMHLLVRFTGSHSLFETFSLSSEASVPTWFSSAQLLLLAALLLLLASSERHFGRHNGARAAVVLALAALYFSIDETAGFHGAITGFVRRSAIVPRFSGEHGIWIVLYGAVAVVLLAWIRTGLWAIFKAHPRGSLGVILGAGVLVAGGAGVEAINYLVPFFGSVMLKETMEMVGAALMVWGTMVALGNLEVVSHRPASGEDSPIEQEGGT